MKRIFNMKTLAVLSITLVICALLCVSVSADYSKVTVNSDSIVLENDNVVYSINSAGVVTDYVFKGDGVSYLGSKSYVAYISTPLARLAPVGVVAKSYTEDSLVLEIQFDGVSIEMEYVVYDGFITVELLHEIPNGYASVNLIDIKYNTTYSKTDFASFAYALNINTQMESYPNEFHSQKYAKATTYSHLGDKGIGAKIALVTCDKEEYYDILQYITEFIADPDVLAVSDMGGPYAQTEAVMEKSVRDYAIVSSTLTDDQIRFYLDYNVTQFDFHQGTPFTQGSMDFAPAFGDTAEGFKENYTDRIKKIAREEYGVDALTGLHTYAYYISTSNTALLSNPETVRQLEYFPAEVYTLSSQISSSIDVLPIYEDNSEFNLTTGFFVYNMRYIRVDDEIMYVRSVTGDTFVVDRGQCGTTAASHRKGSSVYHLTGLFNAFAPREDSQLFKDIAYYTAEAYVKGGFEMIYLDALDGMNRHTTDNWYYEALFVKEITRNIREFRKLEEYKDVPDPIFEYSTMHNSIWNVRTRAGAMDTFTRGYKFAISQHSRSNSLDHYHYTYNVGWYSLYESEPGPFVKHTHFTDIVDLLGKNIIAHNMGFSYNGLSAENVENYPLHKRNADLLVKYLKLRDEGYFTDDIIEAVSDCYEEWALIEKDGEYGFEHRDWSYMKFVNLEDFKQANNPFSEQVPSLIRVQALLTDTLSDQSEVVIADYDETVSISESVEKGVIFDIDPVNISTYKGLAVRVYGNGKGGKINVVLTSTEDTTCSRVIDINFTGWRTVFLSEWDNGLFDFDFTTVLSYQNNRTTDTTMISAKVNYLGDMSGVYIDTVKLVKASTSVIENPSVTYNDSTVTFAATIDNGDYIEFDGTTAMHYDYTGAGEEIDFTVDGSLIAPAGEFTVSVGGTSGSEDHSVERMQVFMCFAGEQVFNDLSNEAIESIQIKSKPDKTSYLVGETLDPTGIEIYQVMNTGRLSVLESGYTVEEVTFTTPGIQEVTVSYGDITTTFKVNVINIAPVDVELATLPDKTAYYVGQSLDTAGLSLTVYYNNGSVETVTEGFTVSPESFAVAGDAEVTVTFEKFDVTFTVSVVNPTLLSLAVTTLPTKTTYTAGEMFSTAGLVVTGTYNSGLTAPVTDYVFTPNGALTTDVTAITIEKNGITTTVPVTVKAAAEASAAFRISANNLSILPGVEFTVDFTLQDLTVGGMEALEFTTLYDTRLTVSAVNYTAPDGWDMWEMGSEAGKISIALVDDGVELTPAGEGEVVVSISFTAPADAALTDTYAISVSNVSGSDNAFAYVKGEGVEIEAAISMEISLVNSSDYIIDRENGYVYITSDKTTQAEFFKNFNGTLTLSTSSTYVGTGAVVSLLDGDTKLDSLTVILKGDINGNGQLDTTDYSFIKRAFTGQTTLNAVRSLAADVNGNGRLDTNDYLAVKKHYTAVIDIFAK